MQRRNIAPVTMPYESDIIQHAMIYGESGAMLPIIRIQKKSSMLLAGREPESMESPKRITNFQQNASEKWAPQTSACRLKSLSDHRRSYSTLVRSIKSTKITSGQDKAKLDRIRQGCIPTITLRDDTETMIESDLEDS
jgi:hypothetical protein